MKEAPIPCMILELMNYDFELLIITGIIEAESTTLPKTHQCKNFPTTRAHLPFLFLYVDIFILRERLRAYSNSGL